MGISRDRVLSGRKAAATNQLKRADYYSYNGSIGGKVIGVIKGLAAVSREKRRVVALKGVEARKGNDEKFAYVVTAEYENKTLEFATRAKAREYKKILTEKGMKAKITQYHYHGDWLLGSKEVR